jgi:hypothetical protein
MYEMTSIQNASLAASADICSGFNAGDDCPSVGKSDCGSEIAKGLQTRCLSLNEFNGARKVKWARFLYSTSR